MDGVGVHEGDLEAEEAAARRGVDQLGALTLERLELGRHIVDLVGDVVHPRSPLGQEAADRSVLAERRQQLDTTRADAERGRLDALIGHGRPVLELGTEEPLVRLERLVQVVDRYAKVVDAAWGHSAMLAAT